MREAIALGKAALRVQRLPRDFGGDNCSAGALPCVFAAQSAMAAGAARSKEDFKSQVWKYRRIITEINNMLRIEDRNNVAHLKLDQKWTDNHLKYG